MELSRSLTAVLFLILQGHLASFTTEGQDDDFWYQDSHFIKEGLENEDVNNHYESNFSHDIPFQFMNFSGNNEIEQSNSNTTMDNTTTQALLNGTLSPFQAMIGFENPLLNITGNSTVELADQASPPLNTTGTNNSLSLFNDTFLNYHDPALKINGTEESSPSNEANGTKSHPNITTAIPESSTTSPTGHTSITQHVNFTLNVTTKVLNTITTSRTNITTASTLNTTTAALNNSIESGDLRNTSDRGLFSSDNKNNTKINAWSAILGIAVVVGFVALIVYLLLKTRQNRDFIHRKLIEETPTDPVLRLDNSEPLNLKFDGSAYYNPGLQSDHIQMTNFPGGQRN